MLRPRNRVDDWIRHPCGPSSAPSFCVELEKGLSSPNHEKGHIAKFPKIAHMTAVDVLGQNGRFVECSGDGGICELGSAAGNLIIDAGMGSILRLDGRGISQICDGELDRGQPGIIGWHDDWMANISPQTC